MSTQLEDPSILKHDQEVLDYVGLKGEYYSCYSLGCPHPWKMKNENLTLVQCRSPIQPKTPWHSVRKLLDTLAHSFRTSLDHMDLKGGGNS